MSLFSLLLQWLRIINQILRWLQYGYSSFKILFLAQCFLSSFWVLSSWQMHMIFFIIPEASAGRKLEKRSEGVALCLCGCHIKSTTEGQTPTKQTGPQEWRSDWWICAKKSECLNTVSLVSPQKKLVSEFNLQKKLVTLVSRGNVTFISLNSDFYFIAAE